MNAAPKRCLPAVCVYVCLIKRQKEGEVRERGTEQKWMCVSVYECVCIFV